MMSGTSTFSLNTMDAPANNLPTSTPQTTTLDLSFSQEQDGNPVLFNETLDNDFEVDSFLLTALSNPRDRLTLLKLDTDLEKFIKDPRKTRQEFPPMSSYQRLIVHRVAQYFKLDHVVVEAEPGKRAVVLYKTPASRVPIIRLVDLVEQPEQPSNNTKAVKIMRRSNSNTNQNERSVPTKPLQDLNKPHTLPQPTKEDIKGILQNPSSLPSQPENYNNNQEDSKGVDRTLEEREVNYAKARARIFGVSEDTPLSEPITNPIPSTPTPMEVPKDISSSTTNGTNRKPRNTVHTKYNEPLEDAHEYSRNLDDWRATAVPQSYMWAQPIPAPVPAVPINYFDIQMNGTYQRPPTGYPVAPHPTWDDFSNAYRMSYPSAYYPPVVSPHHFPPLPHPQYQQQQQPIRKSPQPSHKTTDSRPPAKASQYYAPVQNNPIKKPPSQQFNPQQITAPSKPDSPNSASTEQTSPVMAHKPPVPVSMSNPGFVPRGNYQTYEDMWGYSNGGSFRTYPSYQSVDSTSQERKLLKKEPTTASMQYQQNTQFRTSSPAMTSKADNINGEELDQQAIDSATHVPRSPSHDSFFSPPPTPVDNTQAPNSTTTTIQQEASSQVKIGPTLLGHILEVVNMKTSMNTPSAQSFLEELKQHGGLIKLLQNGTVLVVFKSVAAATKAVQNMQQTIYSLKPWKVQVTNVVIGESPSAVPSTPAVDTLANSLESLNMS
mmetsp:Transcript_11670/g.16202  ORF Transcript_11670/g.16202 Transcript_11670/m.16202 type:complete len:715 (-) Transcript_11670:24-2168(-)